jgi:hypothetical protein
MRGRWTIYGVPLVEHCFSGIKFLDKKYLRADSAYCHEQVGLTRFGGQFCYAA